jgi:hypothetical protein
MRKIKSFRMFETRHWPTAPGHFIPLNSIGCYLDPEEGVLYAMLKGGGYEDEPYDAAESFEENMDTIEILSEEEWKAIDSVWKEAKGIIEPALNKEFIDDMKDVAISEEILDKGFCLKISAKLESISDPVVYIEWFGHDKDDVWYPKMFINKMKEIEGVESLSESIYYSLTIMKPNHGGWIGVSKLNPEEVYMVKSLMSRLGEMDPKMFSRLEYVWW